jgi:hypothetical protein
LAPSPPSAPPPQAARAEMETARIAIMYLFMAKASRYA